MENKQKFQKGDLVRVAKDLGGSMSHFTNDCNAIVIGSYADRFGGDDTKIYSLFIEGEGKVSWYYEDHLTLIEYNRLDLLDYWEREAKKRYDRNSDIDWIFENGKNVLEYPQGASVERLGKELGITNLWGSNGEGYVYHHNAMRILDISKVFLASNDKEGFLKFCEENKKFYEQREVL